MVEELTEGCLENIKMKAKKERDCQPQEGTEENWRRGISKHCRQHIKKGSWHSPLTDAQFIQPM